MTPPIVQVVTGKGGVGKTTVACALALGHLQAGRRVLLAELNGRDRAAAAFGVPGRGYAMNEVEPGLTLIDLSPEQSLKEYVLLIIKLEAVYRLAFENRFVKSFLRLLPALGELTMLGKLWYEWQLTSDGGKGTKYDAIVVDAPATGHAQAILSAPLAVMASVPAGPMRDNAKRIDNMLLAKRSGLVIVTTPDDTPVAEAEELLAYGRERGFAHIDVVANRTIEGIPAPAMAAAAALSQRAPAWAPVLASLTARNERERAGVTHLARLMQASLPLPQRSGPLGRAELAHMAAALRALWGTP